MLAPLVICITLNPIARPTTLSKNDIATATSASPAATFAYSQLLTQIERILVLAKMGRQKCYGLLGRAISQRLQELKTQSASSQ